MKVSAFLLAVGMIFSSTFFVHQASAAEALTCQQNMQSLRGESSLVFKLEQVAQMSPYEMRITIASFEFYSSRIEQLAEYFEIADNGELFIQKVKDEVSGEEFSTVWFSAGDNYFGYTFDSQGNFKFSFFDSTCEG